MRTLATLALLGLSVHGAQAEIVRVPVPWTVSPPFERNDATGKPIGANTALSGAACVPGTNSCLAANDEGRFAQFFTLGDHTLAPGRVIGLLPRALGTVKQKELDAEGVAYAPPEQPGEPGYYYVTGSHGLARQGEFQSSRFFLVRFPVDPTTGAPTFTFTAATPAPEIARTDGLRAALRALPQVGSFAEEPLNENGVTIEGLAVLGRSALFGLRSPCIDGHAFVVQVPLASLFQLQPPMATASALPLGDNAGVLDLAAVKDGVLILSGRSDDRRSERTAACGKPGARPQPAVWFWSGVDGEPPRPLGRLPGLSAEVSAETLLVLNEDERSYRVLVLFDGLVDGGPMEFSIGKQTAAPEAPKGN